jgi:hypothetical protein
MVRGFSFEDNVLTENPYFQRQTWGLRMGLTYNPG